MSPTDEELGHLLRVAMEAAYYDRAILVTHDTAQPGWPLFHMTHQYSDSPSAVALALSSEAISLQKCEIDHLRRNTITRLRADLQLAAETLRRYEAHKKALDFIGAAQKAATLAARFEQTLKETQ